MPVDRSKLSGLFSGVEIKLTPEDIAEMTLVLEDSAKRREKREREDNKFISQCNCHTGGICYFHTRFM